MSLNTKRWPNVFLTVVSVGLFAACGFLLRTVIFVDSGHAIMTIISYTVYIFCYSHIVFIAIGKSGMPLRRMVIGFFVCGAAACGFYWSYQLCNDNLSWIFVIPLPETLAVLILCLYQMNQSDCRKKKILYIEGAYTVLSVVMILLFTRDAEFFSPFYLKNAETRDVWVHDALQTTNELMTILSVVHCLFILLVLNDGKKKDNTHSVSAARAFVFACMLFLFFGLRAIIEPNGAIAYYYNRETSGVVESGDTFYTYGLYSEVSHPVCTISGRRPEENIELTNVAPDHIELYDHYKGKLLAKFSSAEGERWISDVSNKSFVSDYANEVILLRENDAWKVYYTKELKNEPRNALLTKAIWNGVDRGYILLAVYTSDYLKKEDTDEYQKRIQRWSQGNFTIGESQFFSYYDKQAVINWAARER